MSSMNRRQFHALAGAALLAARHGGAAESARRIEVDLKSEIGTIRPELHSHFAEHIGTCTYGGLWVGKNSSIPNINGHRKQAVEYLKALGIPVLRWPGGCFADDYHWRDGIGPAASRPRSVNLWWGQSTEDNSFGTHEFMELCRLIGAEPYLAGNVGSGTPQELRNWMEYCNFPSGSTLADERIANGGREPFGVRYWGVGNENWGCGGTMTPEEYAGHYRRFATYLRFNSPKFLIACGPNGNSADWTRRFFTSMGRNAGMLQGFAMHYYSWGGNAPTKFTATSMREQLSSFALIERAVMEQHALLREFDPQKRIGLMVDEWGVWDRNPKEDQQRYGSNWQQITMRSAVAAALGLNLFHRQADKLVMCNIAQIVNVLHSLLLAYEQHCVRTPTYYTYELMKPHRGKTAVRVDNPEAGPVGLSVSASRDQSELILTLVNPRDDAPMSVECSLAGGTPSAARARLLHHADRNACNTFEQPDTIVPAELAVEVRGNSLRLELPALAVATVRARISV